MDKVLGKINQTRLNWWQAFKLGINLKGYNYYKPPPEIKYRYPAPGSAPHDEIDHPHLYKKHWKTPWRESPYNIQKKEKKVPDELNSEYYVSQFPEFDPADFMDQAILREQIPSMDGKQLMFDQENMSLDERKDEIWKTLEEMPKVMNFISHDYNSYSNDLDQEYFPRQ